MDFDLEQQQTDHCLNVRQDHLQGELREEACWHERSAEALRMKLERKALEEEHVSASWASPGGVPNLLGQRQKCQHVQEHRQALMLEKLVVGCS